MMNIKYKREMKLRRPVQPPFLGHNFTILVPMARSSLGVLHPRCRPSRYATPTRQTTQVAVIGSAKRGVEGLLLHEPMYGLREATDLSVFPPAHIQVYEVRVCMGTCPGSLTRGTTIESVDMAIKHALTPPETGEEDIHFRAPAYLGGAVEFPVY